MDAVGILTDNTPAEVAGIVGNFGGPGEVAVLDHHHGRPVGWVKAIVGDETRIWLLATIEDDVAAATLRRGPVGVSLEMAGRSVTPRPDERGIVLPVRLPTSYRGRIGLGWTLEAIAMLRDEDRPGGLGSAMWAI